MTGLVIASSAAAPSAGWSADAFGVQQAPVGGVVATSARAARLVSSLPMPKSAAD